MKRIKKLKLTIEDIKPLTTQHLLDDKQLKEVVGGSFDCNSHRIGCQTC